MNDIEFRGDLYYVDPNGNSWRITQRPGERNPKQNYWHADRVVRPGETLTPREGHRVSASAYRLLIGIDGTMVEGVNDGSTAQDGSNEESDDNATDPERYGVGLWQFGGARSEESGIEQRCEIPEIPRDIENRRQAYLG